VDVDDFSSELYNGVVRVDGPESVGTGFVASPDGLIVTCAHVLAGCRLGDTVTIVPHATREPLQATVEILLDPPDVAVLELTTALPPEVAVLPLGHSPRAERLGLLTFGYPKVRPEAGIPGKLSVLGLTDAVGYRQLVLQSNQATLGFSGAPVWDPKRRTVVGIIKSIVTQDPGSRLGDTAIGVPAEVIQHLNPKLRNPAGSPYGAVDPLGVCFVSSEYPPRMFGGLGSHVEQLATAISQHLDVTIVLPHHLPSYAQPPSPRVTLMPLRGGDPSYDAPNSWLGFSNSAADRIDDIILEGASFDLIHCHDWVTILAGVRCRWRHRVPLVFHIHLPNRAPLAAAIENLGLACADLITVNSESMRAEVRARTRALGLGTKQIRVINNGVDLNIFRPRDNWPADDGYILFVGRLVTQKGVEYLIRAFYYVLQKFPDIRLKVVGDGDLGTRLRRLCTNLMISAEHVEIIRPRQWMSRPQVAELFQGARLVVVPSIYEPFGMTAIEALACQRPVIASRTGGLMDIITPNVNGFLAEPRDELDLAQWIMALLSDAALRNSLGEEGRRLLSPEYTWPRIARRVVELYGNLQVPPEGHIPSEVHELKRHVIKLAKQVPHYSNSTAEALFEWEPKVRRRHRP
jgi:glycosyltransferase involved in cell wall biosynthesis